MFLTFWRLWLGSAGGSRPELHQSYAALKQGEWLLVGSRWAPLTAASPPPYLPAVTEYGVESLPAESEHVINESNA